jgi:hypothetical protein
MGLPSLRGMDPSLLAFCFLYNSSREDRREGTGEPAHLHFPRLTSDVSPDVMQLSQGADWAPWAGFGPLLPDAGGAQSTAQQNNTKMPRCAHMNQSTEGFVC